MMPGNTLSSTPIPAAMLAPDNWASSPKRDFERGGVALGDPSQGLLAYNWEAWIDGDNNFFVKRVDEGPETAAYILYQERARNIGLAFDRNMNPSICYQQGSDSYLYWYDSTISGYRTTKFEGATTPRITHDDKRADQSSISDVMLFYIRAQKLYFRMQRDRYATEYYLYDVPARYDLKKVGMGTNLRLQFILGPIV